MLVPDPAATPDLLDELRAGEGHRGPLGQGHQQIPFGRCQRNWFSLQVDLLPERVDLKIAEYPWGRRSAGVAGVPAPWATQDRLHACHQLAHAEGFGDVVIGAHGQADQGVHLVRSGGHDDDVAVAEGADLAADLDAVQSGQSQVEDHHVWGLLSCCFDSGDAVVLDCGLVPAAGEIGGDHLCQRLLVLDDEHLRQRLDRGSCAHDRQSHPRVAPQRTSAANRRGSSSNLNAATTNP